ncbi:MAG: flagellar biosynthetic protein FliO [Lachnospiraceae bacterium]|nr:flagellar biosynthetic protein FliO [Lachnospiraceae bacterium]
MLLALDSSSGINSFAQFLTVLIIFIGVLALTYFTTRWVASYQKGKMMSGNIQVLETFKITQNKYIQIIRIGDHLYAIAIGKDTITLLGELSEDEIHIQEASGVMPNMDFKQLLENAKNMKLKK